MKCQILFSEKNKKNISKCRLLKILPRVLSVKLDGRVIQKGKLNAVASYRSPENRSLCASSILIRAFFFHQHVLLYLMLTR